MPKKNVPLSVPRSPQSNKRSVELAPLQTARTPSCFDCVYNYGGRPVYIVCVNKVAGFVRCYTPQDYVHTIPINNFLQKAPSSIEVLHPWMRSVVYYSNREYYFPVAIDANGTVIDGIIKD